MNIVTCHTVDIQGPGSVQFMDQIVVSLKTLRKHRRPEDTVEANVLYGHLTAEAASVLMSLSSDGFSVKLSKIPDQELAFLQRFTKQSPASQARAWCGVVFARLFLPTYLSPTVDRVLYLDSDTMVRRSLHELFLWDLKGRKLGMVMGCVPEYGYNSGVMVMDLKAMREDTTLVQRLVDHMTKYARSYFLPDQTVINRFFAGDIEEIPAEYNYPPVPGMLGTDRAGLENAAIWHFYNQGVKPVRFDDQGLALVEWNRELAVSADADERPDAT